MLQKKKMGSIYKYICVLSPASTLLSYCLGDLKLPIFFMEVHIFDGIMFLVEHNFEVDVIGRFLVAGKTGP